MFWDSLDIFPEVELLGYMAILFLNFFRNLQSVFYLWVFCWKELVSVMWRGLGLQPAKWHWISAGDALWRPTESAKPFGKGVSQKCLPSDQNSPHTLVHKRKVMGLRNALSSYFFALSSSSLSLTHTHTLTHVCTYTHAFTQINTKTNLRIPLRIASGGRLCYQQPL